ncbi:MAG: hypothetical protein L0206_25780, partial [Actinobacteria bacterium]|nr:hypothetical protein [Actinomycetota bacterium]
MDNAANGRRPGGRCAVDMRQLCFPVEWCGALGIAVLGLLVFVAQGARAQLDLTEVEISISIDRVNDASGSQLGVSATITVRGSGITSATITPMGLSAISIDDRIAAGERAEDLPFSSVQDLSAALPNGNYILELDSDDPGSSADVTATIGYAQLDVVTPAISAPGPGEVVPVGPVTVSFASCPACGAAGTLPTTATLERSGAPPVEQSLAGTTTSWVPSDPTTMQPLALPPETSFRVRVRHTRSTRAQLVADPSDDFTFTNVLSRSEAVAFTTGFAPPEVDLCLVVNDPTNELEGDLDGCTILEDPQDAILDSSGTLPATAAGVHLEYVFSVNPRGWLSGFADVDVDGDGSLETHVPISGRLSGSAGRLRQLLRIPIASAMPPTKLTVRIREQVDTTTGVRTREQKTRGTLRGGRVVETTSSTDSIVKDEPKEAIGWRLDFRLSGGAGQITDALLTLANDPLPLPPPPGMEETKRTVALFGRHRFLSDRNRSNVRLKSGGGDSGVRITI